MLVYKDGDTQKDILGFQCDRCNHTTLTSVIPNDHGEFRYTCPKCGYKMNDKPAEKEEEIKMVNAYTVSNAAKRLNCSMATIGRAIQDGRFHDCFMEAGYHGRPAWMIPSDQVEEWVTRGGFLQMGKAIKQAPTKAEVESFKKNVGKLGTTQKENNRTVFDPEVGKQVPVLDLLGPEDRKPEPIPNEFKKRVVKRVAKPQQDKKYVKVLDRSVEEIVVKRDANGKPITGRYPWGGDTDGDEAILADVKASEEALKKMQEEVNRKIMKEQHFIPVDPGPVVRKDGGFSITIPTDLIENMVYKQLKSELAEAVGQMRVALALANETMKKLEEAIA